MKNTNKATLVSVMSIFFIAMGIGTITPAIAAIAGAFPDVPFTTILLVSTLPSLLIIPSTLITGAVVGKQVKFKTLSLLGLALFALAGMAPAFLNSSFTLVLVSRAVFGIALGIISPLGNAIIMGLYEGQERANYVGVGGLMMNIGGIVLQFLGGVFADISWELSFLGHAPAIISFFLVLFFLKEPEAPPVDPSQPVVKDKMPAFVWALSIVFGFLLLLIYPMLVNFSSIMINVKQVGDSSTAALALAMYTVGGALAGAVFGKLYAKVRRFIIPAGLIGGAAGIAMIVYANSAMMMIGGTLVAGLFFMLTMPAAAMLIGMKVKPSQIAMGMSIMMAVMNIFAFLSTYWIGFVGNVTGDVFLGPLKIAVVAYLALGVVFLFYNPFPADAPAPVAPQAE
ncbi:MFS transporter [Alkalibacter mobilis]|uniref:MFS transporter n=1 Tax=Alkalibacter mobilis TaxID=2787712 RepID=UPI00189CD209|nr:MFS transporter [Alkalibacter mobilis]MBF7097793.1 MFS transporter [Alkalibacter mobilis]